jgi:hypothetical protein
MPGKEEEIIKHYPESSLLVELAKNTWNGNVKAARVDFSLSDRLKVELKILLDKDIKSIFITDSDVRHIKKTTDREKPEGDRKTLHRKISPLFRQL